MKTGLKKSKAKKSLQFCLHDLTFVCTECFPWLFGNKLDLQIIFHIHFLELNPKLSVQLPSIKWPAFTLPLLPNSFFANYSTACLH